MKIIGRLTTVVILIVLCRAFMSCCGCDYSVRPYRFQTVESFNLDNLGEKAVASTATVLSKDAFGIRLRFDVIPSAMLPNTFPEPSQAGIYNSCSGCGGVQWVIQNPIRELNITTLADFDQQHPAGSDVSGLFKILDDDLYIGIDLYTERQKYPMLDDKHLRPSVELFLLTPPTSGAEQSFKIDMNFYSDTLHLSTITQPVMLQ